MCKTLPEGCGPSCDHNHREDPGVRGDTPIFSPREDPSINPSQSNEQPNPVDLSKVELQSEILAQEPSELQLRRRPSKYGTPLWRGPNSLPFEFRALEACLESACHRLDREVNSFTLFSRPCELSRKRKQISN